MIYKNDTFRRHKLQVELKLVQGMEDFHGGSFFLLTVRAINKTSPSKRYLIKNLYRVNKRY